MKLVRENIEFKRGLKPKESLEIGGYRKISPPFNIDQFPNLSEEGANYFASFKTTPNWSWWKIISISKGQRLSGKSGITIYYESDQGADSFEDIQKIYNQRAYSSSDNLVDDFQRYAKEWQIKYIIKADRND